MGVSRRKRGWRAWIRKRSVSTRFYSWLGWYSHIRAIKVIVLLISRISCFPLWLWKKGIKIPPIFPDYSRSNLRNYAPLVVLSLSQPWKQDSYFYNNYCQEQEHKFISFCLKHVQSLRDSAAHLHSKFKIAPPMLLCSRNRALVWSNEGADQY